MTLLSTLLIIFFLGIVPACAWLWFWLRQDKAYPEPPKLILTTFAFGALSAIAAFILQNIFNLTFNISSSNSLFEHSFIYVLFVLCVWSFIEEVVKYFAGWYGGLHTKETDEAIDAPIYMISAALGFAALENVLFLLGPLLNGNVVETLITAKMRFIGSTLVHVASSGLLGMFIGYSIFFMKSIRKRYFGIGLILATLLHALFNLFIIRGDQNSFIGFLIIWLFIILLIVLFEYIKKIKVNRIQDVRKKEKENTY
jgi:protease PrsW